MKNNVIKAGDKNSIIIHAHLLLTAGPHPFLKNFPYGAETKKSMTNTKIAVLKIMIKESLYKISITNSLINNSVIRNITS
jgi:hypothetical protein